MYIERKKRLGLEARKIFEDLYGTKASQSGRKGSWVGRISRDIRDTFMTSSLLHKEYQRLSTEANSINKAYPKSRTEVLNVSTNAVDSDDQEAPTEVSDQDEMNVRSIASSLKGKSRTKRDAMQLPILQEDQTHGRRFSKKTTANTEQGNDLSSEVKSTASSSAGLLPPNPSLLVDEADLSRSYIERQASAVTTPFNPDERVDSAIVIQHPEHQPTTKPDYKRNTKTSTSHKVSVETQGGHHDYVPWATLGNRFAETTKLPLQIPEVDATSAGPPTDSGYASQRQEDASQSQKIQIPKFEQTSQFEKEADSQLPSSCEIEIDLDDLRSMESDRGSIGSKVSTTRFNVELFAIKYLATFFAQLNDLRPLHEAALRKIERSRFVQNYGRVLKLYYRRLFHESVNDVEKEVLKVLRSRQNRESIAEGIARYFEPADEEEPKSLEELMAAQPAVMQHLETWLGRIHDNRPHEMDRDLVADDRPRGIGQDFVVDDRRYAVDQDPVADDLASRSSDSGSEVDVDPEEAEARNVILPVDDFVNMNQAERFLQQGSAFRNLILDIRLLIMPGHIREIFETTPKASIQILSKTDPGRINRAKVAAEAYTGLEWDWWPLAPPIPKMNIGEHHLQWKVSAFLCYPNRCLLC